MTKLLLARHGETDWNRDGRWQGHSNTPLNDSGRRQALELADRLGDDIDAVYSSDLARAHETANIVAERLGLDVHVDERLRERSFGAWEGLTMDDIEGRFAEAYARWRSGDGPGADDAEAFETFGARIQDFLEDVLAKHPDETVLVVAHGGSLRVIHAVATGLDYLRDHRSIPPFANCAVSRYAVLDGKLAAVD